MLHRNNKLVWTRTTRCNLDTERKNHLCCGCQQKNQCPQTAHGNIDLYAVCPACRAGRCLFLNNFALAEQLQNSERLNFVRKKKRRRPRKARRWLHEGKVPCALNQNFFLIHEYLGSERPVSFEVSAPTRLSLRGSHVRRKFRKRTTLRSESSTLIGLLYAG